MPGNWEMRIFWNDQGVSTFPFRISVPPSSVVQLAGRTVLPRGTVQVQYFFQLRAEGGSPPYRWSMDGSAPPGLSLSPAGALTGVPLRRGSYKLLIHIQDASGNSLTRALGLGIGEVTPGPHVTSRVVTKSPSSPDACATPTGVAKFSTRDLTAWLAFSVEDVNPEDNGRVEWLNPLGEVSQVTSFNRKLDPRRCYEFNMPVAGSVAASKPGPWRARLFWRDAEILTIPFEISDADTGILPGRRALVVGQGGYKSLPSIPSADADSTAVAEALRQDGFEVTLLQNSTLEQLQRAESDFTAKLQRGDVAVVYFTGYGFQRNGDIWLPAANFDPADTRPTANAYSVRRLRGELDEKQIRLAVIVLDAAREQPSLAGRAQSVGLARMTADGRTVLVYAIPPGRTEKVSEDSSPGPFAQGFAKAVRTAGTGVQQLLLADLPKAVAAVAFGRPAPVSLVETAEEFVFRPQPVIRPVEFVPPAAARQLSGTWEFGRAESTDPKQPVGPLCKFNLTENRGAFGNVIAGNCNAQEAFWRLEGDRFYLVGIRGMVTSVLFKTSQDEWKGPYLQPVGVVHYLKRAGPHTEVAIDPKLLVGYAGKYQLKLDFVMTVTNEGGHLFVQATGQQKLELFPESNRDFFIKTVDAQITFETDASGRAGSLVLHQNGANQVARRIE
jgi:hypothetical protein